MKVQKRAAEDPDLLEVGEPVLVVRQGNADGDRLAAALRAVGAGVL